MGAAAPGRAPGPVGGEGQQPAATDPAAVEPAKWLAVVAMTVDHANKLLLDMPAIEPYQVGRLAFPLFAWVIAHRLAARPELAARYLQRLIPWAALSQPAFVFAFDRPWHDLNILFTLSLGVAAWAAGRRAIQRRQRAWMPAALGCIGLGILADYGPVGVAMVPLLALAGRQRPMLGALLCGPLGWLANGDATPLPPEAWTALFASPAAALVLLLPLLLPRLPGPAFYLYYPAHLAVLAGLGRIFP